MKLIITSATLILLVCPLAWPQSKQVRDANGRLVETWHQRGSTTDVRGPTGTLLETRTERGNDIEVRDRNGRLLKMENKSR